MKALNLIFNPKDLEGKYTGAARGRTLSAKVKSTPNGICIQYEGMNRVDTLNTYVGNHTWMSGNDKISIENKALRIDQISGYYILKKEE